MKTFSYRGFDITGQLDRGLVEALDAKEARERLAARGIFTESLAEAGRDRASAAFLSARGRWNAAARATIYRELGALLRAGVPLLSALQIVIQAAERPAQAVVLSLIRDRVREGDSFSAALVQADSRTPAFERSVLAAGERSGALEIVLEQLADHLDEQLKVDDRLKSALVYPAFVVALAIVVAAALLGFVLPNLARMFAETRMELPWVTRALLWFGRQAPLLVVGACLFVLAGGWIVRRIRSNPESRERFHASLFRWPVVGRNVRLLTASRFAQTFSLLFRGGVGAVEAMELSGDATGNHWLALRVREEAAHVRHGRTLADAIKAVPPMRAALGGWIEAGEASGRLVDLLERAGARLHQQWNQHLTRCMNALEPILILAVGLFVLVIALAVLLPILSLNQSLS